MAPISSEFFPGHLKVFIPSMRSIRIIKMGLRAKNLRRLLRTAGRHCRRRRVATKKESPKRNKRKALTIVEAYPTLRLSAAPRPQGLVTEYIPSLVVRVA